MTTRRDTHWSRRMLKVILALVILYALYSAALLLVQGRIIFPRWLIAHPGEPAVEQLGVERWWRDIGDGRKVEAWFIPAPDASADAPAPLVLLAHGNGELIDHHLETALMYRRLGLHALLVEYRGYGRSDSTPSQRAITEDTLTLLDRAVSRPDVDAARLVYHGRSIGGGVVCAVAMQRPPRALILESTFTSVQSMAGRYGALPFLVRHPFRNDLFVRRFNGPILFFHGTQDTIIPIRHSRALLALARDGRLVTQSAGHNDFPANAESFWREIGEFLDQHVLNDPLSPTPGPTDAAR